MKKIGRRLHLSHWQKQAGSSWDIDRYHKCFDCGKLVSENEDTLDRDGNAWCYDCEHNDWEYPSTVVLIDPNYGVDEYQFTDHFSTCEDNQLPTPIANQKWVNSGGWRGYTDWDYEPGYVEYADGWVTGWPDETTRRKLDLAEIFEDLKDGTVVPPAPIYWVFGHTSNVFSTSTAIVVRQENIPVIQNWLNQEELQEMLS